MTHNIVGSEAYLDPRRSGPSRDVWAGMLRFVRSRRPRRRASPRFWVSVAWAVLPNLIGTALFLLVVGLFVGVVR